MIVAGFGFADRATTASLVEALTALSRRPDQLATLRAKADTALFRDFATAQGLPVIPLDEAQISGIETPTHSPRIAARFHTGSVAEAAALVAAGPGVRLIQTRYVTTDGLATVALAEMTER